MRDQLKKLKAIGAFLAICIAACTTSPTSPSSQTPAEQKATQQTSGQPTNSTTGAWESSEGVSAMDGSKTVTLSLAAENEIRFWLGSSRPHLVVRCREKKTDVYVVTGTAADVENSEDTHTVRIRLDQSKAFTEHWDESTDHQALFSSGAVGLARRISKSHTMLFEFTPFNASPATAEFTVNGLNKLLPSVADACGWTP